MSTRKDKVLFLIIILLACACASCSFSRCTSFFFIGLDLVFCVGVGVVSFELMFDQLCRI